MDNMRIHWCAGGVAGSLAAVRVYRTGGAGPVRVCQRVSLSEHSPTVDVGAGDHPAGPIGMAGASRATTGAAVATAHGLDGTTGGSARLVARDRRAVVAAMRRPPPLALVATLDGALVLSVTAYPGAAGRPRYIVLLCQQFFPHPLALLCLSTSHSYALVVLVMLSASIHDGCAPVRSRHESCRPRRGGNGAEHRRVWHSHPCPAPSSHPLLWRPPPNMDGGGTEEVLIDEEYKIWKKNTPFLYDLVLTKALEWPSLTVQWLPDRRVADTGTYCTANLLLGTHTSDEEQNYLMIAEARLPHAGEAGAAAAAASTTTAEATTDDDTVAAAADGRDTVVGRIEVKQRLNHDGEQAAGRGTYRCAGGAAGARQGGFRAGVESGGAGELLSGSDDARICLYDVGAVLSGQQGGANAIAATGGSDNGGCPQVQPLRIFTAHDSVVEDVAWSAHHSYLFASAGDDKRVMLWDTREMDSQRPFAAFEAHTAEVNCVAFSPFHSSILVSGSNDGTVAMWDTRYLSVKMHSFESHTDVVQQVAWSPTEETILASAGADRRTMLWDLSRIGQEQSAEDAEDGPPELLFVHGGHTAKVSDFGWSANEPWLIASVAEDNMLQVWQIGEHIYADDDEEAEGEEGEDAERQNGRSGVPRVDTVRDEDLE
eukprot:ctg_277.g116